MATRYHCENQARRQMLIGKPDLNGIDYLEVADDQRTLRVVCINPVNLPFTGVALIIGGARVRGATLAESAPGVQRVVAEGDVWVTNVAVAGRVISVTVNQPGDFSTYTLRLVAALTDLRPPSGFDRQLAEVRFSFKVDCPADFDCAPVEDCPPEALPQPEINYLAKDYASFRQLMLDRLSVIMPGWQERNPADVLVMLVEALAYVGDHLSYYQDAVATEAYLGTARQRISLRRHARLLDYVMHDGCNARAWVCFEYAGAGLTLEAGTQLLTRGPGNDPRLAPLAMERVLAEECPEVFETLHSITLQAARSAIRFHTWGDTECCLPAGVTRATLVRRPGLTLQAGMVLIFEEVKSPTTGLPGDADPSHRHAVRLTAVAPAQDELYTLDPANLVGPPIPRANPADPPLEVLEIAWALEDALPFPLCLSAVSERDEPLNDVSLARGNVVLADHGLRIAPLEDLDPVPAGGHYRPRLQRGPLTQQSHVPDPADRDRLIVFDPAASASAAMRQDPRHARPAIRLLDGTTVWTPQRDLLASDRFATEFVVEVERDGAAHLRFGDDILGQRPAPGASFKAEYRVGNGTAGNVGAGAIARIVHSDQDITRVWNPLPAMGGVEPEAMEPARQFAPQALRVQERAVTSADYVEVTQRHADVQRAAATYRWTGSWYTAFVTVDRLGGLPVDARFEADLRDYLNRYRLAGYDLEITSPVPVSLDIVLRICVAPGHFPADVRQALVRAFSNAVLPDGRRGFFHPDNFTFGQPLYLSQIYAAALAVEGVATVEARRFKRQGRPARGELAARVLTVGPYEVIRLDNDPNFPEHGKIEFEVLT